jgi:uncharacterized SAM-binding protein YcdF (DUF218 family)
MGTLVNILVNFMLPPFGLLVTAVVGFALLRWRPRLGRILVAGSFVLLWVVLTPAVIVPLLAWLGWPGPVNLRETTGAQAIVVLSGGVYLLAPEYGGHDSVNSRTLERVRYAAHLHRETGLPILASGGRVSGGPPAEAELMQAVLEKEFSTPVRWIEVESRSTLENARLSARILKEAGIGKALLVTESIHMRRALQSFSGTGIEVVPAPTAFVTGYRQTGWTDFLPGVVGFSTINAISHELLGRAWYAVRQRLE